MDHAGLGDAPADGGFPMRPLEHVLKVARIVRRMMDDRDDDDNRCRKLVATGLGTACLPEAVDVQLMAAFQQAADSELAAEERTAGIDRTSREIREKPVVVVIAAPSQGWDSPETVEALV